MTKFDLIEKVVKASGRHPMEVEKCVNLVFEKMKSTLCRDDRIEIRGFGSFENRVYGSYEGRNPKTGKSVKVAPKRLPFFKVGLELKRIVNEGAKTPKA
jgi:integration host factor subunit beta